MRDINEFRITEPTPAYDVISIEIELMRDEPKRVRMETWGEKLVDGRKKINYSEDGNHVDVTPSCGYVGCAAGWFGHIRGVPITAVSGSEEAASICGFNRWNGVYDDNGNITDMEGYNMYDELRNSVFLRIDLTSDDCQGTPEHVEKVIAALRAFQVKYEERLRRVLVYPVKATGAGA